jgi:hypothetical protein
MVLAAWGGRDLNLCILNFDSAVGFGLMLIVALWRLMSAVWLAQEKFERQEPGH